MGSRPVKPSISTTLALGSHQTLLDIVTAFGLMTELFHIEPLVAGDCAQTQFGGDDVREPPAFVQTTVEFGAPGVCANPQLFAVCANHRVPNVPSRLRRLLAANTGASARDKLAHAHTYAVW